MQNVFISIAVAAGFCLVSIPLLIPFLRRLKFGQQIRLDGPRGHFVKSGTPTMGGIVFFVSLPLGVMLTTKMDFNIVAALLVTFGFGLIGFIDDFIKVIMKRPLGLKAREKIFGQLLLSAIFAWVIVIYGGRGTEIILPGLAYSFDLGWFYIPFAVLVMTSANAVNLTDGLDGLAAGVTLFAALGYLLLTNVWGLTNMSIFSASLLGCCLGFLFFNMYPARIFMGDTGSFILGGALCSLAILTKTELLLLIIGGVYVLEALSVIMQVIYFRFTGGKRLFLMSPLHHHFELLGWAESKVVIVFWITAAFFASIAVILMLY
ncbi:MAG: phospho-N-acetylmuramoyl-pentapeptide-transferase [Firmicutes bacterium HGW-Firmicutes-12]|nr:MAG: phospho-N-acetylmuramoyl-pentapeptide-transferase [Firmicutes bacterium HGW-Firmicutes-12]